MHVENTLSSISRSFILLSVDTGILDPSDFGLQNYNNKKKKWWKKKKKKKPRYEGNAGIFSNVGTDETTLHPATREKKSRTDSGRPACWQGSLILYKWFTITEGCIAVTYSFPQFHFDNFFFFFHLSFFHLSIRHRSERGSTGNSHSGAEYHFRCSLICNKSFVNTGRISFLHNTMHSLVWRHH